MRLTLPYRWGAVYVVLVYLLYAVIFSLYIPPATNALVASEHLRYLHNIGRYTYLLAVAVVYWPLAPVIVAPLFDVLFSWRQKWSWSTRAALLALVALLAGLPIAALRPTSALSMLAITGGVGALVTFLLAYLGALAGTWLGAQMGEASSRKVASVVEERSA